MKALNLSAGLPNWWNSFTKIRHFERKWKHWKVNVWSFKRVQSNVFCSQIIITTPTTTNNNNNKQVCIDTTAWSSFSWRLKIIFKKVQICGYIEVKVGQYLLFMFSPPKISWTVYGIKNICLHVLAVFYLTQPSRKQIICFDFEKQNSALPCNIPYNFKKRRLF